MGIIEPPSLQTIQFTKVCPRTERTRPVSSDEDDIRIYICCSKKEEKSTKPKSDGVGINLVNEIGEQWDEREYDEEFKVNQFLKKLKN